MRHILTASALACALALSAGCGADGLDDAAAPTETSSTATLTPTSSDSPSTEEKAEPEGARIEMTLKNGKVTPAGDRDLVLGQACLLYTSPSPRDS